MPPGTTGIDPRPLTTKPYKSEKQEHKSDERCLTKAVESEFGGVRYF